MAKNFNTKFITIHVSATKGEVDIGRDEIDRWHRNRGFAGIGYHYVIRLDGTIEIGRSENKIGAHVKGYNRNNIGICFVGGLSEDMSPKDTRTPQQKESALKLLKELKERHPMAIVKGHRDFSKDLNGNGVIEPFEWSKLCPVFDAKKEYESI